MSATCSELLLFSCVCLCHNENAVTTVVQPEQPPSRFGKRRLLLAASVAAVAILLVVVGACNIGGEDSSPADNPPIENNPGDGFIENATFVLQNYETIPMEAHEEWRDLKLDEVVSRGLPYTRYNRYYTRFFLKQGEAVEIVMQGSVPLGADLGIGVEGISVMLLPANATFDPAHAHDYLPPMESDGGGYFQMLTRTEGKWQIGWAIAAPESDYYWLMLENYARQDAWCHLTVSMPSG